MGLLFLNQSIIHRIRNKQTTNEQQKNIQPRMLWPPRFAVHVELCQTSSSSAVLSGRILASEATASTSEQLVQCRRRHEQVALASGCRSTLSQEPCPRSITLTQHIHSVPEIQRRYCFKWLNIKYHEKLTTLISTMKYERTQTRITLHVWLAIVTYWKCNLPLKWYYETAKNHK